MKTCSFNDTKPQYNGGNDELIMQLLLLTWLASGLDAGLVADPAGEPVQRGRADAGREAADGGGVRVGEARVRRGGGRPRHPGGVPAPHDRAEPRRRSGGDDRWRSRPHGHAVQASGAGRPPPQDRQPRSVMTT